MVQCTDNNTCISGWLCGRLCETGEQAVQVKDKRQELAAGHTFGLRSLNEAKLSLRVPSPWVSSFYDEFLGEYEEELGGTLGTKKTGSREILTRKGTLESREIVFFIKNVLPHNVGLVLCPQIKGKAVSMEPGAPPVANRAGQLGTNSAKLCEVLAPGIGETSVQNPGSTYQL